MLFISNINPIHLNERLGNLCSTQSKKAAGTLPIRAYLDQTVVPLVLKALAAMVEDKPENEIEYVANYLLKNNPENQVVHRSSKWYDYAFYKIQS